mmetsp:Transcript_7095/g.20781  ORF Transcript_7095/g.20781 Transcript_7095/m.20781 type:complete len:290 (+) Transcript_7095:3915-4784(+)
MSYDRTVDSTKSIPLASRSVDTRTQVWPDRNFSMAVFRAACPWSAVIASAGMLSRMRSLARAAARSLLDTNTSTGGVRPPAMARRSASSRPWSLPTNCRDWCTEALAEPRSPTVTRTGSCIMDRARPSTASDRDALNRDLTRWGEVQTARTASTCSRNWSSSRRSPSSSTTWRALPKAKRPPATAPPTNSGVATSTSTLQKSVPAAVLLVSRLACRRVPGSSASSTRAIWAASSRVGLNTSACGPTGASVTLCAALSPAVPRLPFSAVRFVPGWSSAAAAAAALAATRD